MPTLAEVREQYPQYNDMSDAQLATALHSKFYSDMPRSDFNEKIGLKSIGLGEAVGNLWEKPPPGPSLIGMAKGLWEGVTLPRDVYQGKVDVNTALMPREAFTDIPAPTEHGANTTPGIFGNTLFAPQAAHPSDELTGRAAALATLPTLAPAPTALTSMRGGALGSGPVRMSEGVPVLPDQAAKIIAQRMAADKLSPRDVAAMGLQAAQAGAHTVTPLDLAGPNVTRLAGTAFRTGGDAAERISTALGTRAEGQGERLSQSLTQNLADPNIAYRTAEEIAKQRSAGAKTAYNAAYAHPLETTSPSYQNILGLLETDAGQAAMKKAATIICNEERSPKFQPFTVNKQTGEIMLARPPDTKTLHYVLRGLDDVIDNNKVVDGFGKSKLTQLGGTVQGVKDTIRGELFQLNPKFKAANNAYASASEMRTAIETGMDFLGKPAEVIASEMGRLSDAAKEMYRLGAARAVQGKIGRMMPESDKTVVYARPSSTSNWRNLPGPGIASTRAVTHSIRAHTSAAEEFSSRRLTNRRAASGRWWGEDFNRPRCCQGARHVRCQEARGPRHRLVCAEQARPQ